MNAVVQKARNVVRGLVQVYGTERIKRSLWNYEFAGGRWGCLEGSDVDALHLFLEKYARGGSILDLGCGPGTTAVKLSAGAYRRYTGVDISDVAIEKARNKARETSRDGTDEYFQSDIVSYVPAQPYDVILFGDSLYYIAHQRIAPMLVRYANHLGDEGVFMARLFDVSGKHQAIVDIIEGTFDVVEKHLDDQVCVLVFRPRAGRRNGQ